MIYVNGDTDAFVNTAAAIAQLSLSDALRLMTGRTDWAPHERFTFGGGFARNPEDYTVVRVSTAKLNADLARNGHAIPENDHNYRRRYGAERGGDREHWEKLMACNPAQHLPLMIAEPYNFGNSWQVSVHDWGGDAQYLNATLRDNRWPVTLVACKAEGLPYVRRHWAVDEPAPQHLRPDFMASFSRHVVEALEVLRPGTALGEALKLDSRPAMNMAREDLSRGRRLERLYPRGNRWCYRGDRFTTEELLDCGLLPPAAVAIQVHHIMVSAMASRINTGNHSVPAEVLATYRRASGGFAPAY